jgi:hypothetical protein
MGIHDYAWFTHRVVVGFGILTAEYNFVPMRD